MKRIQALALQANCYMKSLPHIAQLNVLQVAFASHVLCKHSNDNILCNINISYNRGEYQMQ